ncbi:hypothetical protein [Actinopolymorpha pittospori]|uniref:Uncharacterized protein n=1 Tax=Actinopolymorpha pittospori TaxID=648752 RepID=A0A927N9A9_9ACTN|nr:hypothetical protein [Actinopolymorpha pittospori]MBE1612598.1 hypothetical protein [Actinopolymorpha pittospori]
MTPGRRRVPHSAWIALAVATAGVGWSFWWLAGDLLTVDNGPDLASREYVESRLAEAVDAPMVLPVRLPDGYDYGRHYSYTPNDEHATAIDGEPTFAQAREVMFMPHDGVGEDGDLPAVALCVEDASAKRSACPHPGARDAYIQRRYGRGLLTFYAASDGNRDLSAWKTVELTTDLNKVRWLH